MEAACHCASLVWRKRQEPTCGECSGFMWLNGHACIAIIAAGVLRRKLDLWNLQKVVHL